MREGLKLSEVHLIAGEFKRLIEDGEEEDVAYSLACRTAVTGIEPKTLKAWKPDIIKLAKGEPSGLDPLPAKAPGGGPFNSVHANLEAARKEAETHKATAQEQAKEIERLKAELAKKK
jgi:hypothetical protein